jgi:hypothetical protein
LVETLRFGVVSSSIPPVGRAVRWHVAPQIGPHPGAGSVRVRYIGERAVSDVRDQPEIIVDDPGALSDCPTLRLRIELTLWPMRRWHAPWESSQRYRTPREMKWNPPWLDYVLLKLEQAPRGSR